MKVKATCNVNLSGTMYRYGEEFEADAKTLEELKGCFEPIEDGAETEKAPTPAQPEPQPEAEKPKARRTRKKA